MKSPSTPKIIARQDSRVLVIIRETPNPPGSLSPTLKIGCIVDMDSGKVYPEITIDSVLARGYWESATTLTPEQRHRALSLLKTNSPTAHYFFIKVNP